jgi:hypothetical protein
MAEANEPGIEAKYYGVQLKDDIYPKAPDGGRSN